MLCLWWERGWINSDDLRWKISVGKHACLFIGSVIGCLIISMPHAIRAIRPGRTHVGKFVASAWTSLYWRRMPGK